MIGNNLNIIIGALILGLVGISYLLRKKNKYLPQMILFGVALIFGLSSLITRSLADQFVGILALILAVGSSALIALVLRKAN